MFDIGFSELLLIGIVALVVIGPERLPKVARTAGHLFGRLQRYVSDVKADINREIHAEELQKLQEQMRASVNSIEDAVKKDMQVGSDAVQSVEEQIHEIVEIPQQPIATTTDATEPPPAEAPVHVAEEIQPQMELNLGSAPDPQAAPNKNV